VITPHTGDARGWKKKLAELFCENVSRFLAGAELRNQVSAKRGY
jgi:phosphoglycerate dehydrogenase-like enzyme